MATDSLCLSRRALVADNRQLTTSCYTPVTISKVPTLTLRDHVRSHTATLLRRMAFEVRQTAVRNHPDAIHDLRVSIRRLRECLGAFACVYPPGPHKKIRKRLRRLMKCTERVRSADIALDLLAGAGMPKTAPLLCQLRSERAMYAGMLQEEIAALSTRSFSRHWREGLGL